MRDSVPRIGYLSAFFHAANYMKPVWGLINHHDRSAFEIHLFSDSPRDKDGRDTGHTAGIGFTKRALSTMMTWPHSSRHHGSTSWST